MKINTIRLPQKVNDQLLGLGNELGFSRSDLIKTAILKYLVTEKIKNFKPVKIGKGEYIRTGIILNPLMERILNKKAEELNVSVNSLIIFASQQIYEEYSLLIKELNLKD